MDIHVDLVPAERPAARAVVPPERSPRGDAPDRGRDVVLVVDVIRSATTAALLLDRGAPGVHVTAALRAARAVAARTGAVLVGERDGMPPEGFNFGNSPVALRSAPPLDRPAVLLAAESPRALARASDGGLVALVGLNNALAAARHVAALDVASLAVVCAGTEGEPDLSDVVAAGLLVSLVAREARGRSDVRLSGAARFCLSVLRTTSDPLDGLWHSVGGTTLRSLGFDEDVAVASAVGTTDTVPWVHGSDDVGGRPVVRLGPTVPA